MKKNKKMDNIIQLCFKYNFSCNSCPRNAKCEEETNEEENKGVIVNEYSRNSNSINNNRSVRNNDIYSSSKRK